MSVPAGEVEAAPERLRLLASWSCAAAGEAGDKELPVGESGDRLLNISCGLGAGTLPEVRLLPPSKPLVAAARVPAKAVAARLGEIRGSLSASPSQANWLSTSARASVRVRRGAVGSERLEWGASTSSPYVRNSCKGKG